jgi:heme exporter protein A
LRLLQLRALSCVRGGRLLFDGLDLALSPGEAAIVTGPNGVGKSSLIRVAGGLLRPSSGTVEREGAAALADEGLALDDRLTLGAALDFWARLDGVDAKAGMESLGIAHLAAVPVRMLSAGQRKRAALARVAASGAPLWLLDEPANGLDTEGCGRLAALIGDHRARGGAVLAASHLPLGIEDARTVALA